MDHKIFAWDEQRDGWQCENEFFKEPPANAIADLCPITYNLIYKIPTEPVGKSFADSTSQFLQSIRDMYEKAEDPYPEMKFDLEKIKVGANKRKLTNDWCFEIAEDYEHEDDFGVEDELIRVLSEEIKMDMDSEILASIGKVPEITLAHREAMVEQRAWEDAAMAPYMSKSAIQQMLDQSVTAMKDQMKSIVDQSKLVFNSDGTIDVWVQPTQPVEYITMAITNSFEDHKAKQQAVTAAALQRETEKKAPKREPIKIEKRAMPTKIATDEEVLRYPFETTVKENDFEYIQTTYGCSEEVLRRDSAQFIMDREKERKQMITQAALDREVIADLNERCFGIPKYMDAKKATSGKVRHCAINLSQTTSETSLMGCASRLVPILRSDDRGGREAE